MFIYLFIFFIYFIVKTLSLAFINFPYVVLAAIIIFAMSIFLLIAKSKIQDHNLHQICVLAVPYRKYNDHTFCAAIPKLEGLQKIRKRSIIVNTHYPVH